MHSAWKAPAGPKQCIVMSLDAASGKWTRSVTGESWSIWPGGSGLGGTMSTRSIPLAWTPSSPVTQARMASHRALENVATHGFAWADVVNVSQLLTENPA